MPSKVLTKIFAVMAISAFVLVVGAVSVSAQQGDRAIEVTSSADVSAATSVNNALNSLVKLAATCKTPGMACACGLEPGLHRLSAAYHAALSSRPSWKERAVQYVVQSDGRAITIAINFPAIRRQLDICHVP